MPPTDILIAQDAPITLTLGGDTPVSYTLPVWQTKELLPVLSRLKQQRLDILRARCKEFNVPAVQTAAQVYVEETKPLNPWDAHVHFCSAAGVDECLLHAMKKAGLPEADAEKILSRMRFDKKQDLAVMVAGIYEPAAAAPPPGTKLNEGLGFGDAGASVPDSKPGFGEAGAAAATAGSPRPTPPAGVAA